MESITVTVELHEFLASKASLDPKERSSQNNKVTLSLPAGASISSLLEYLGLVQEYVGLIIVNGAQGNTQTLLSNGDKIALYPPLSGGC